MITLSRIILAVVISGVVACNDSNEEKFETISKLRTLGVAADPIGLTAGGEGAAQTATMTFFLVAPLGATVQYEPYQDDRARYAIPIDLAVDASSEKIVDYAKFSIHQVNAVLSVPAAGLVPIPSNPGFARIRYGLRAISGSEEEIIVGTLVLYANSENRPAYEPLGVSIDLPLDVTSFGEQTNLQATIDNKNSENVKIGWLVSSGTVKNRRAKSTQWQDVAAGQQTVVVTVRGMKSGSFAYAVRDVSRP